MMPDLPMPHTDDDACETTNTCGNPDGGGSSPGSDGETDRSTYVTGNGSAGNPYVYHADITYGYSSNVYSVATSLGIGTGAYYHSGGRSTGGKYYQKGYYYDLRVGSSYGHPGGGNTPDHPDEDELKNDAEYDQAKRLAQLHYIKTHGGRAFADMVQAIFNNPAGLDMGDVYDLNQLVEKIYLQLKANYMMSIFSPDIVAEILTFSFGVGVDKAVQNTFFKNIPILTKPNNVNSVLNTFRQFENKGLVRRLPLNSYTNQEIHFLIDNGATRVNFRIETHALSAAGPPVRHANVQTWTRQGYNWIEIANHHIIL